MNNSLTPGMARQLFCCWIATFALCTLTALTAPGASAPPGASGLQTASRFLREELPLYVSGPDERIVLSAREKAGEFFTAPSGFDTISFQVLHARGYNIALHFAIYGPFPEAELPVDYALHKIGEHNYAMFDDQAWLQANLPRQQAGHYYWEITNRSAGALVGCYARRGATSEGHSVIRNTPTYWMNLKSTIAYQGPDLPLRLSSSALLPETMPDARARGFGSLFSLEQRLPASWLNDADRLPGAGWRSLAIPYSTKPEFWPTIAELQRRRIFSQLIVAVPHWDQLTIDGLTGARVSLRGGNPSNRPLLDDPWDPEYLASSRAAMTKLLAAADSAGVAGAFQLLGAHSFNYSYSQHARQAWPGFLQGVFGDLAPHTDDNGDGVTYCALFGQELEDWSAAAPFSKAMADSSPPAALLSGLFFDQALSRWVKTVADTNNSSRPFYVVAGELNQLARMPSGIGLALENFTPHQLDILARLDDSVPPGMAERPGAYALRLHPQGASPERLEQLRWLFCRNLDRPLGFILDELDLRPPFTRPYQRPPSTGLVDARINLQTQSMTDPNGQIVRLKRAAQALAELSPFMSTVPSPESRILVIAADLTRAPLLSSAAYVAESRFLEQTDYQLARFSTVIVSAAGETALGGALLERLEQFVKQGGQVLLAPAQFKDPNSLLPLTLPETHAEQLIFSRAAENQELKSIYKNTFTTEEEFLHDTSLDSRSTGPISLLTNHTPQEIVSTKDGKLSALLNTSKAELIYKIRIPPEAKYAQLRVRYESWHPGDWTRIWWSDNYEDLHNSNDLNLPQTKGQLNEFTHYFDVERDLPHEILYMIVLLYSGSATRGEGEFHGSSLDEMEVSVSEDPLFNARQAELDGLSVIHYGNRPLFAEPSSGRFKPLGTVTISGGETFPLAVSRRQGLLRGGRWIYVNCPELLAESGSDSAELLNLLLARVMKKYQPPPPAYRVCRGDGFIALTKNDHEAQLEEVELETAVGNGAYVVYDYFKGVIIEHERLKKALRFKTELLGPYAAKLLLIKPADFPVLLKADGMLPHAAKIASAGVSGNEISLSFAKEACIYSRRAPQAVTANGQALLFEYDESTNMLYVFGNGVLRTVKVVF